MIVEVLACICKSHDIADLHIVEIRKLTHCSDGGQCLLLSTLRVYTVSERRMCNVAIISNKYMH